MKELMNDILSNPPSFYPTGYECEIDDIPETVDEDRVEEEPLENETA